MSAPVDVLADLRKIADGEGDAELLAMRARAAIAELIEAAIEMAAEYDTYAFDFGITQHGLSVKDRIEAALRAVGGAE